MENEILKAPNFTYAQDMQGAHNMPCRRCGKVDWKQTEDAREFPLWDCQTKDCDGMLWSE